MHGGSGAGESVKLRAVISNPLKAFTTKDTKVHEGRPYKTGPS